MRLTVLGVAAGALLVSSVLAADSVQSGPAPGDKVSPFHPLNVTGQFAGEKQCLVWANGSNPVVMVFAKKADGSLTGLVKKLEAAVVKNKSAKLHGVVVLTSDAKGLEGELKKLAETEKIEHTVLTIDNPGGPKSMKLAKDADVTVVLYVKKQVKAIHAFKGELADKEIDQVLGDLPKIVAEKKSE